MATNGEDDLGDFFAEINEIEAVVSTEHGAEEAVEEKKQEPVTVAAVAATAAPVIISQVVTSKPAEIKPHTVYTYDESIYGGVTETPSYAEPTHQDYQYSNTVSSSSTSNLASYTTNAAQTQSISLRTNQKFVRKAADEVWVDESLKEWPENDYRIFVGDLAKDATTEMLVKTFCQYPSFAKAKVIRDGDKGKSKGYGFVSFLDPMDCAKALREMNGKYLQNRPMKIRKSTWQERDIKEAAKKENKKRKMYESLGIELS
eukprot:gene24966-30162_t